jgi:hypothetical protein
MFSDTSLGGYSTTNNIAKKPSITHLAFFVP